MMSNFTKKLLVPNGTQCLYENFDVLPDWDEARDEEGYVSINFYVDEKVEENE